MNSEVIEKIRAAFKISKVTIDISKVYCNGKNAEIYAIMNKMYSEVFAELENSEPDLIKIDLLIKHFAFESEGIRQNPLSFIQYAAGKTLSKLSSEINEYIYSPDQK